MKLKDCSIGMIVKEKDDNLRTGYITGLDTNSLGGVVLLIKWAIINNNKDHVKESYIHPSNIRRLEETDD